MFSCHLTAVLSKRLLQSQVFLSVFPLKQVRTAFKSHLVYRYLSIMSEERKPFERLPANVVPRNYNLSLQPDLQKFVFSGSEVVSVEVIINACYKETTFFVRMMLFSNRMTH